VLLLLGITLALVAVARPVATVGEPRRGDGRAGVRRVHSMTATDVPDPARRRQGGSDHVRRPAAGHRQGGRRGLRRHRACHPTAHSDRAAVTAAIRRLTPSGQTSVGTGILSALGAVTGKPVTLAAAGAEQPDIGWYAGSAIVILSDGGRPAGPIRWSLPTSPPRPA
jgi:Ca-activated chloride channel family protein